MIIAIDTGGTKTLISLFDNTGQIVKSHKFPTPDDKQQYIDTVREHLISNFKDLPIEAISVAVPGIVKDGVVASFANLSWTDFDAAKEFAGLFANVPIMVENDANLAGVGEAHVLDPIPQSLLYITISTGIGIGIVENGDIAPATSRAEGGHIITDYEGQLRDWETFAAGSSIYRIYGKYARDIEDDATWREIAGRLAPGFGALIPIIQPEVIVVGGSVGTYLDRYERFLRDELEPVLHPITPFPRMIKSSYPEEAVVYGCYYHAKNALANR